jgi:hypothetical protein
VVLAHRFPQGKHQPRALRRRQGVGQRSKAARAAISRFDTEPGDRILIMGEDVDGKTDDILDIVVKVNEIASACNRQQAGAFEARLLSRR